MQRISLYLITCLALCLAACSKSRPPAPPPQQPAGCIKTGCSGIVCAEPGKEVITTCEYRPEYACYKTATCERQTSGACGWTQTAELTACLANPPPMPPANPPPM
jgi:eight-cysteine-cluster-containing protein